MAVSVAGCPCETYESMGPPWINRARPPHRDVQRSTPEPPSGKGKITTIITILPRSTLNTTSSDTSVLLRYTSQRSPCKLSQSCRSSHSSPLHPAWRSKEEQSTTTRPFRHDSFAVTTATALAAQTVAVGHVNSVAAAWTGLATRAMTVMGSVATMQMQFVWLDIASAPKGRFAERIPALGPDCLVGSGSRHG